LIFGPGRNLRVFIMKLDDLIQFLNTPAEEMNWKQITSYFLILSITSVIAIKGVTDVLPILFDSGGEVQTMKKPLPNMKSI